MTEAKDNYPQEKGNIIGDDKLSPEEKERLSKELTQLFTKLFYDDPEDTGYLVENLLRKGLWKQSPSHYATVIEKSQYLFNYNIMCSMIYDDPRLRQPSKHLFHSDIENTMWCVAHQTYIGIRCIIQGN